ncbi:MAG: hypothetical protein K0Q47_76 [Sedimentibacter sp.]|jgi:mRNA-degrading endonuclease toxin of MazEF toxin-antitoxin module/ribosomal protein L31|nr:hypothetical protein [Sedimentibacter sp.]
MSKRIVEGSICQRGQVWWIPENENETRNAINNPNNSVTAKSRTYLIVSCKENNEMSTTINCVVVSTKAFDYYPMHVPFEFGGVQQMVQCEQIRTFDIREFTRLKAYYKFSLTQALMDRVNIALIGQLELNNCIPGYSSIMSMIENIAKIKAEEMKNMYRQATEDDVADLAAKVESMLKPSANDIVKKPETKPDAVYASNSSNKSAIEYSNSKHQTKSVSGSNNVTNRQNQVDKFNNKYDKSNNGNIQSRGFNTVLPPGFKLEPETKTVETKKPESIQKQTEEKKVSKPNGRNSWDEKTVKQFLADCEKLSPEEIASTYNLKDKKTVYQYKYKFQQLQF